MHGSAGGGAGTHSRTQTRGTQAASGLGTRVAQGRGTGGSVKLHMHAQQWHHNHAPDTTPNDGSQVLTVQEELVDAMQESSTANARQCANVYW